MRVIPPGVERDIYRINKKLYNIVHRGKEAQTRTHPGLLYISASSPTTVYSMEYVLSNITHFLT